MLRLVSILLAVAVITFPLMPVQWFAVALRRPLRRRIPVFYHRFVCRLIGVRVRTIGAPVSARSAAAKVITRARAVRPRPRWCSAAT